MWVIHNIDKLVFTMLLVCNAAWTCVLIYRGEQLERAKDLERQQAYYTIVLGSADDLNYFTSQIRRWLNQSVWIKIKLCDE